MQGDNFSIGTQLELMRVHWQKEGADIIELADQGSAFIGGLERSQLRRALELAREKQIDALMFFSPDRWASSKHSMKSMKALTTKPEEHSSTF